MDNSYFEKRNGVTDDEKHSEKMDGRLCRLVRFIHDDFK